MPTSLPALGICLEEYDYPYPVQFLPVTSDLQALKMAYMDIPPDDPHTKGREIDIHVPRGAR